MRDTERDTLNRLGEQLRPPEDAFDRFLTRRDRRRRGRRATAAAVALTLTAAGVLGVLQIGRRASTTPGAQTPLPSVARLECGPSGAIVATPEVRPQPDGVHLDVTNTGTTPLMVLVTGSEFGSFVERAEPGPNAFTASDLKPASYEVRCSAEDELNPQNEPAAALTVTDPDGLWKDPLIACPEGQMVQNVIYDPAPGATGEDAPPEEIARRELGDRVREGDILEHAGYPEASDPVVRVVRGEHVIANVYLMRLEGGLRVSTVGSCEEGSGPTGSGSEPPTG